MFILYSFEIIRENMLINNLDVNPEYPNDNDEVKKIIDNYPECRNKIVSIDKKYQISGYISIFIFVTNAFLSGFCIYDYYLNNQTTITFITYLLFSVLKLLHVWDVAHTDQNVFYSSYIKTNVQFNDIDPKYKRVQIDI
jgi:hypothetical protein